MSALTDPLRGRILLVLERNELTVTELCTVFQLPQSTMSRHLKGLTDEGWLLVRAEGTSRRYSLANHQLPPEVKRLWRLIRDQVVSMALADQDAERLRSVLTERRTKSQEFFSSAAGEWDRMRAELLGRRLDLLSLLGLVDDRWTIGDLGCGTGQATEVLAPFVHDVIAIDDSEAMLSAARDRVGALPNVQIRSGTLENLPLQDMSLDAAVVLLVLHHLAEPATALREVGRVLKPGGRLLLVDMKPHQREEYKQAMGHLWLGFSSEELEGWVRDAGLEGFRYVSLPADPEARGPLLFAASARTPREEMWIPGSID